MGVVILAAVLGYLAKDVILTRGFAIYFAIQSILMFILANFAWRVLSKMKKKHTSKGYESFCRTDTELWSYPSFIIGAIFLFPFRLIAMLVIVSTYLFWVVVITAGHDFSKPLTSFRKFAFTVVNKVFPRLALFAAGYLRIKTNKLKDFDYSKWLGKDYTPPKYYASSVSNHSAWTDLFVMLIRTGGVSFVSKESIKHTPLFGKVGIALNTIFISRISSHEEKEKIVEQISERQKGILESEGKGVNLHIFPEGATTNNTTLIPFKRGVFAALYPVLPVFIKYSSARFNPAHDVMPMHVHFMVLLCQFTNYLEVTELPIFEPNEHLFKTYAKPKEEKWETYARAVRDVLSQVSGLPTSELSVKEKFACKEELFGDKYKND